MKWKTCTRSTKIDFIKTVQKQEHYVNNKNEAAHLAATVKKMTTLMIQFIALSKQLQQSSEARNE